MFIYFVQLQLEEGEELHAETLKKYKSAVSQISVDQISLTEQAQMIDELETQKQVGCGEIEEVFAGEIYKEVFFFYQETHRGELSMIDELETQKQVRFGGDLRGFLQGRFIRRYLFF